MNRDNTGMSRRRKVRLDQESIAPSTYAERRARFHRPQGQQYTVRSVSRTFAQTGVAAPEGLDRSRRRLPPMHTPASSSIPPRSSRVRKRGFLRRMFGIFSVVAIVIAAIGFALISPSFRIHSVAVMGTTNPAVIHAIAHMNMVGQNIFLIDLPSLTDQIDALPPVESANLQKVWPDQLVVNVVERLPVILWQAPQGAYTVDSHGVVIALATETSSPAHLMTIVDMRSKRVTQQVQPGTRLNSADITFALQVFEQVPQVVGITQFTLRYTLIGAQPPVGSFSIASSQGWIAYLGSATDSNPLSNRLVELQQILKKAQQDQVNLATIDLRYGLRPVFTVKP